MLQKATILVEIVNARFQIFFILHCAILFQIMPSSNQCNNLNSYIIYEVIYHAEYTYVLIINTCTGVVYFVRL